MIYDTLKQDLNTARKARDSERVLTLSTVMGEIAAGAKMVDGEKVIDDALATSVIKKTVKGLDELLTFGENTKATAERALLMGYLPTQLSEDSLRVIIRAAITEGNTSMGAIMAYLKTNHTGLYDGKIASRLATDVLAGV